MAQSLSASRLINVVVNVAPAGIPFANFNSLLIVGASPVIDTLERIRSYDSFGAVADDFDTTMPEYAAAALFFMQSPQPAAVFIGRWAQAATNGELVCGPLTTAEQQMVNWTNVTAGSFGVSIDGRMIVLTSLDFAAATNLNGVAAAIQAALRSAGAANAICIWNGLQFQFGSGTTGPMSTVSYLSTVVVTDISGQLKGTAALAQRNVVGMDPETAAEAVVALDSVGIFWYGLTLAMTITDDDHHAIAEYIEAASSPHVYGINTNDRAALTGDDSSSIGYVLKQGGYHRSLCLYSSTTPYATTAFFGRAFTVDFTGSNTVITMMWQELLGVVPEDLSDSEADALDSNNYNYVATFTTPDNAILVNGAMAADFYFDEVWRADWLGGAVQTNLFNLLYSARKIPQTDPGIHLLVNSCEATCQQGVTNGSIASGQWTASGFGTLVTGANLPTGYYVYAPPVATQSQADREARKSPLIQIAVKLAGAVHTADVLLQVNR
jgi:hypothetical protein